MENNDLVKPPITQYGDRTMKIRYRGHSQSAGEWFMLFFFFGFLVFPNVLLLLTFKTIGDNIGNIIAAYAPHIVLAIIFISLYFFFRSRRLKNLAKTREIVEKGQMVIGSLQSIEAVSHGSADDKTIDYYLRVKYKKPGSEEESTYNTPYLTAHPQLRNEELPLKVKVYIHEGQVYVDEIIDPPFEKIQSRKRIRAALATLAIILAVGGIGLMAFDQMLIGVIMFFAAMVLLIIINFRDRL